MTERIKSGLMLFLRVLGFMFRYPWVILAGWAAAWAWIFQTVFADQGMAGFIQLGLSGFLNMTNVVGIPFGLFFLALQAGSSLFYFLKGYVVDAMISLWKEMNRQMTRNATNVVKKFTRLNQVANMRSLDNDNGMLGAAADDDLLQAIDELRDALEQDGY